MKFPKLIGLSALVLLLAATAAYPQTPTSGARLDIIGTVGGTVPVNRSIYDSQIHSGVIGKLPVRSRRFPEHGCLRPAGRFVDRLRPGRPL